jgi:hypothetical protein
MAVCPAIGQSSSVNRLLVISTAIVGCDMRHNSISLGFGRVPSQHRVLAKAGG